MWRHDTDLTSFVAGLVFVALGVVYLLDAADVVQANARWVAPLAVMGLGFAGLAGSLWRVITQEPPPTAAGESDSSS